MFGSRPTENGLDMAHDQEANSEARPHARPEDPETNARPPGNGDREHPDAERAEEKLEEVSGH